MARPSAKSGKFLAGYTHPCPCRLPLVAPTSAMISFKAASQFFGAHLLGQIGFKHLYLCQLIVCQVLATLLYIVSAASLPYLSVLDNLQSICIAQGIRWLRGGFGFKEYFLYVSQCFESHLSLAFMAVLMSSLTFQINPYCYRFTLFPQKEDVYISNGKIRR